jgi:hypothetical protein
MTRTTLHDVLLYLLAYALLLITAAVSVAAVLEFRSTLNVLWAVTGRSRYTLGLADQLALLVGGLAAFVYMVFLETYYRHGVAQHSEKNVRVAQPRGRVAQWLIDAGLAALLRRFAGTAAIPGGVLIVSLVLRPILFSLLR